MLKRLIATLAVFSMLFALTACSSSESSGSSSEGSSPAVKQLTPTEQFVEDYNASPHSKTDLVLGETFDPKDDSSDHYRVEFRLGAWNGSKGQACSADAVSVDIIETAKGEIRVYAFGPRDGVVEFYRTAAHVLYPEVSDEEVEEAVQRGLDGFGNGIVLGEGNPSTILETPSYKDTGEAMLDAQ